MKRFTAIAALLLATLGARCFDTNPLDRKRDEGVGPGVVGDTCTMDSDCIEELLCVIELPNGFCTRACDRDCPSDSLCVRLQTIVGDELRACSPLCESTDDCRTEDNYSCVSVGTRSVCSL